MAGINLMKRTTKKRFGFTIIEIVIVLVIIGVLATISVLAIGSVKNIIAESQLKNDLSKAKLDLEEVKNKNGYYPTSLDCRADDPPLGCPEDTDDVTYYYNTQEGFTTASSYELYATRDGIVYKITPETGPEKMESNAIIDLVVYRDGVCANGANGKIYCWGKSAIGSSKSPVEIRGFNKIKQFAANSVNICGVDASGKAYCLGDNSQGQLGNSSVSSPSSSSPVAVEMTGDLASDNFKYISLDRSSQTGVVCAFTRSNLAYCWGSNEMAMIGSGDYGDGIKYNTPQKVPGLVDVKMISVGGANSCAIAQNSQDGNDNDVYCWGLKQLGTPFEYVPTPIAKSLSFSANYLDSSYTKNNVIDGTGKLYNWEYVNGSIGQVDGGSVFDASQIKYSSYSPKSWCVITNAYKPICKINSGYNDFGQIGDGSFGGPTDVARPVSTDKIFTKIQTDGFTVCGLATDHNVYCWGRNASSQGNSYNNLGTGESTANEPAPIKVTIPL